MQYRRFGKLDWQASALGFGAMRLPFMDGDYARIDEPEATRMLHYAIDHGVNYVDTAIHYHGGNSERFLGRALKGGYREKVKLATKLFPPYVEGRQDFDRLLDEQLHKLQTDCSDFYLLHGINCRWWPKIRDQCGECEEKCPQSIPISAWMPIIHQVLGGGKPLVRSL